MAATAPNSANCKGYYTFDTNYDDSTDNNDLTAVGVPTITSTAIYGKGLNISGSGIYLKATSSNFNLSTADFTVYYWFNISSGLPSSNIGFEFGGSTNYHSVSLSLSPSTRNIGIHKSTNGTSWNSLISSAGIWSYNTWNMVTYTRSGDDWTIYLNNVSVATHNSGDVITTDTRISMCTNYNLASAGTGNWDELSIFNTAHSTDEMDYMYNSGSPGSAQQYPFIAANNTIFMGMNF